jgi:hypothetical protein
VAIDYNLVTLSGPLTGGEQWSTSCAYNTNFGTGPVKTFEDLQAWATAIGQLPIADYTNLASGLSALGDLTTVRTAYIDSAGATAQVAEAAFNPVWSPANGATMPFQCSVVLSLLTGRPGRSYRGRMYWPALGFSMNSATGKLSSSLQAQIADQAAALLTDIGGAAGAEALMAPVVASSVLGITTLVSKVRVGDVIDTQRRRRNQLVESYVESAVPPAA